MNGRIDTRGARLLAELLRVTTLGRMEIQQRVGVANAPELVRRMRNRYEVPIATEMRELVDRDGRTVRVGSYSLSSEHARRKAREVLAMLTGGANA